MPFLIAKTYEILSYVLSNLIHQYEIGIVVIILILLDKETEAQRVFIILSTVTQQVEKQAVGPESLLPPCYTL